MRNKRKPELLGNDCEIYLADCFDVLTELPAERHAI